MILVFSRPGALIYVLNGTDPEDDPVRYGLTFEKGSREYFRVDPKSGNVTLIRELDREVRAALINSLMITDCLSTASNFRFSFQKTQNSF